MLAVLAFAVVAGVLTILAPCTLPVVPLVLGVGSMAGRRRALGLLIGFGLTFVAVTVLFASLLAALGLTTSTLRLMSAVLLGAVGVSLALPWLGARIDVALGSLGRAGNRVTGKGTGSGLVGGLILGGAIGLIWAPCVGPIMAAVIAIAASHGPTPEAVAIAAAYVVGAAIPMGLIAGWGRRATDSMRMIPAARLQRSFGLAMILSAVLIVSGLDLSIENGVAGVLPAGWSGALVSVEEQPSVQDELAGMEATGMDPRAGDPAASSASSGSVAQVGPLPVPIASSLPASVTLENLGPAPDFTGITAWINSDPLTIGSLRGKVVLVEFWTFECINCIHVQPYVKAWYARYASAGLVIVGVHTPELSFERDIANVRTAVTQDGLHFPIAFDPSFTTWNAYRNSYWPAFYFVDRSGQIRHTHFGEGDYAGSEQVLRELLGQPG